MSEASGFQANLQRGRMLRIQGRYADAEKYLQSAIGADPSRADGYYELAFCYCNWGGHHQQALDTIDRALSLEANRADYFALKAWIQGNRDKDREAVQVAAQALAIEPENVLALNARSRALVGLHEWTQAEASTRETLEIDAGNDLAANLLAIALRQQGRLRESEAVSASILAQVPEDAMSQSNAGWSALHAGDYRRANRHFLEALRLDPNSDGARSGLIHAFNSRVWIYRLYFQYIAWMSRHKKGLRYFFVFVIYVGYRFLIGTLRAEYGSAGSHWILVIVALYFIIFGFGRAFGNFFLLLDRYARHALTRKEIAFSSFVAFAYGLLVFIELMDRAWAPAAVLMVIPACFIWAALSPRLQDLFASEKTEVQSAPGA